MEKGLKSGVCPKCEHAEIYYTEDDNYKIVPHTFSGRLTVLPGSLDRPVVHNLVCGNCGYAEFYVRTRDMEMVKKTWNRMVPK